MMPYKQGRFEWGPAGLRSDSRQVAVHEMAHRLLEDALPHLPSWFNEGLASFLETAFIRDGSVWYGQPSADVVSTLATKPILPLRELLTTKVSDHGRSNDRYYATAWLVLNYLLIGNDGREVPRYKHLWQRLAAEPTRKDWSDVLTDIFDGTPLTAIEAELQHYADAKIVGRPHASRLRQMAITPIKDVPLRDRESDPVFVEEACRNLQTHYESRQRP